MFVAGAAVLSWLVGALIRRYAVALGLIDHPNARSSHVIPTPRGGGLGIVLASVAGLCVIDLPRHEFLALAVGGSFIALVSFIDDLWNLPASLRLVVHIASAAFGVFMVGAPFGALGAAIAVLWIVGLTNTYNFMDGTDGIAGGQGVVAAGACVGIAVLVGRQDVAAAALLIGGACAGFLVHNWSPARLFMGDVGSAFLGYSLALLAVILARQSAWAGPGVALALWPFIFDPIVTLIRRASRREILWQAHRSHLYQRLVAAGWTHAQIGALYIALAAAGALCGVALVQGVEWAVALAIVYAAGTVLIVGGLVKRAERTAEFGSPGVGRV